jgi:2-iminobutanoate/2-iminopropanoate deaminase
MVNESDFPGMNDEWAKWFPKDSPARQGAKLPISPPGMRISIAVIAEVENDHV